MSIDFVKNIIGGPSDFAFGWILILLSSLITLLVIIFGIAKWIIKKLGSNYHLLKNISRLATETNIEYFRTILGAPIFINEKNGYKEFIFCEKNFYVQVATDHNGKTLLFSVTTRKKRFNPMITLGPFEQNGPILKIKLGKTKFSALDVFPKPEKIKGLFGANWYFYSEIYYFGRPGKYQTYVFTANEAGYSVIEFNQSVRKVLDEKNPKRENLPEFREGSIINTYTVIASSGCPYIENLNFGPDYNQVMVLDSN